MARPSLDSTDLPELAPRTQCVLIPRDPNFIYAYWNFTQDDLDRAHNQLRFERENSQLVLRIYDTTRINFKGTNANHTWDLDVGFATKNWYVHVWQDNADYCAELGIRSSENHFVPLTRSIIVHTPPKSTSKRNDLIWQDIKSRKETQPYIREDVKVDSKRSHGILQEQLKKKAQTANQPQKVRVYHLTAEDLRAYYMNLFAKVSKKHRGKIRKIEDVLKGKQKEISWQKVQPLSNNFDLLKHSHPLGDSEGKGASENLVGPQSDSGASEGRLAQRKFFFEIWAELTVYGRTEHDAAVWLNEKGIKLNSDGTFTLRYALPDGEVPLKFIAQSSDGVEQRHILTGVQREKTISFPKMLKEFHG
ncbi:MAG: DUF4912 domain-containing protein [Candidatus Omnitrophota bacterium]